MITCDAVYPLLDLLHWSRNGLDTGMMLLTKTKTLHNKCQNANELLNLKAQIASF